jgi:hypothetical protein
MSRRRASIPLAARPGIHDLHFSDDVLTNTLTINASDPKSGAVEFNATAVRLANAN